MMQEEQDRLELAWRQIRPAGTPPEFLARLQAAQPAPRTVALPAVPEPPLWVRLRGLWQTLTLAAPATALLLLIFFAWAPGLITKSPAPGSVADRSTPDNVQVDHSLVASFDTIAQVPGSAAVRLRCREWQDNIVVHDRAHGVEVTKTTPRIEVIPVRFETY